MRPNPRDGSAEPESLFVGPRELCAACGSFPRHGLRTASMRWVMQRPRGEEQGWVRLRLCPDTPVSAVDTAAVPAERVLAK